MCKQNDNIIGKNINAASNVWNEIIYENNNYWIYLQILKKLQINLFISLCTA